MLNGACCFMDAALLLIAANVPCPQTQTSEHLAAVENMDLKHIIIIQNKIDIAMKDDYARQQYQQIKKFVEGTNASTSPIIPISAQLKYNIDVVIQYLCKLPIPKRDFVSPPRFIVVRSFDINKPGTESKNLKGGVAGGTLIRGILKVGEVVEIKPGIIEINNQNGKKKIIPIVSRIVSLKAEENDLIYCIPGGLIGVGLKIDPFLTRGDRLVGRILGHPGKLPDIYQKIVVRVHLLKRLLGIKRQGKILESVGEIRQQEVLLVNVGSTSVGAKVYHIGGEKDEEISFELLNLVCAEIGEKIAISRKIEKSWRLIGWGEVLRGTIFNESE